VNFGIQWLQKLNIVVNTNLPELVNELTVYKWDEDKDGNVLPKPIDRDNHLIDAIRYALFREMGWGARRGGNIRMPLAGAM
jgi:phage terminase large subunit